VDYYKMDAGERVFEDTELLELFQDKMQWWVSVMIVIDL
jgi:hypothetical protein